MCFTFVQKLTNKRIEIEEINNYQINRLYEVAMQSDYKSIQKAEILTNSIPKHLLYYRTCLSIADGNIEIADRYYENIDIVELYQKLAIKKSLQFPYTREDDERLNDKDGF